MSERRCECCRHWERATMHGGPFCFCHEMCQGDTFDEGDEETVFYCGAGDVCDDFAPSLAWEQTVALQVIAAHMPLVIKAMLGHRGPDVEGDPMKRWFDRMIQVECGGEHASCPPGCSDENPCPSCKVASHAVCSRCGDETTEAVCPGCADKTP